MKELWHTIKYLALALAAVAFVLAYLRYAKAGIVLSNTSNLTAIAFLYQEPGFYDSYSNLSRPVMEIELSPGEQAFVEMDWTKDDGEADVLFFEIFDTSDRFWWRLTWRFADSNKSLGTHLAVNEGGRILGERFLVGIEEGGKLSKRRIGLLERFDSTFRITRMDEWIWRRLAGPSGPSGIPSRLPS